MTRIILALLLSGCGGYLRGLTGAGALTVIFPDDAGEPRDTGAMWC